MGREFLGEQNEKRVWRELASSGRDGMRLRDLVQVTKLDKTTVLDHLGRLIEKNKVRKGEGKHGRYRALYIDAVVGSYLFGRDGLVGLLDHNAAVVHNVRHMYPVERIDKNTRFFSPKFKDNDIVERAFFEFANRVGGYILFSMLQALNPDNRLINSEAEQVDRDELVREWVSNSISPVLPLVLHRFSESINYIMHYCPYYLSPTGEKKDSHGNWVKERLFYKLNKEAYDSLYQAFTRLYPSIEWELDRNLRSLDKQTAAFIEMDKTVAKRFRCKHEFKTKLVRKEKIVQCVKCGKIRTREEIVSNRERS